MKTYALFVLATASLALACSNNNGNNDGGSDAAPNDSSPADVNNGDTGTDAGSNPPPPALKTQVDRMGRPTINTALNHVFDTTSGQGPAKDAYNADSNASSWGTNATYISQFETNLAIFDALDTVCGNQLGYSQTTHYQTLATALADDRLYVDTSQSTCAHYLGVELHALGILTTADCGGRKMTYTPVWDTYTAVSGATSQVTDGLSGPVASKTNGTTFPYLAAPM